MKQKQSGRSMIEMLGVLAIIGVLTAGGVAGFSKAMEMYKMNKLVKEYNSLIFNLIQYKQNFQISMKQETVLADFISNTVFLMPDNWKKASYFYLKDSYDNLFYARYEPEKSQIMSIIYLGAFVYNNDGTSMKWSKSKNLKNICKGIVANIIEPLHSVMAESSLINYESVKLFTYKGDSTCRTGFDCIKYLTPTKIENACSVCTTDGNCNIVLRF